MRLRNNLAAAFGAALLVAAGCGGSGDSSSPSSTSSMAGDVTSDPTVVAAAIQGAGFGCADFAPDADVEDYVDASGVCTTADGAELNIEAFSSRARLDAFLALGETEGCPFYEGLDVPYVIGDYWTAGYTLSLEDLGSQIPAEPYQRVADAIGADVGVMEC